MDLSANSFGASGVLMDMVDPEEDNTVGGDGIDSRRLKDRPNPDLRPKRQQRRRRLFALGGTILAIGILATVWDWDWFRPLVAYEASAALGRSVTLQRFDLRLGKQTVVVAVGVRIANPEGFPQDAPL